jgi:hypothetical protein
VANAQDVEEDNPYFNGLYLGVGILNSDKKYCIQGDAKIFGPKAKIGIDAQFVSRQLLLNLFPPRILNNTSNYLIKSLKLNEFVRKEIGVFYNFKTSNISKNKSFFDHSESQGRRSYYTSVPLHVLRLLGARAGIGNYQYSIQDNISNTTSFENIKLDTFVQNILLNGKGVAYISNYTANYFYIGLQSTHLYNAKLSNGIIRRKAKMSDMYADMLILTNQSNADVFINGGSIAYPITNTNAKIRNIGFRIGLHERAARYSSISYMAEIGLYPGLVNKNNSFEEGILKSIPLQLKVGATITISGPILKPNIDDFESIDKN